MSSSPTSAPPEQVFFFSGAIPTPDVIAKRERLAGVVQGCFGDAWTKSTRSSYASWISNAVSEAETKMRKQDS